jgi:NAD(P)-dependent dehydrogenase (short-subunit alcohol dehydrogenase family)
MPELHGKVAVLTGGARGQGAAEAELFLKAGAAVAICDVLDKEGKELAERFTADGHACRFFHHDVTSEESWAQVVRETVAWKGPIDILINNAGIINRKGVLNTSLSESGRGSCKSI